MAKNGLWLTGKQIAKLRQPTINQNLMQARYDPSCPSEWYRGYVSAIWMIRNSMEGVTSLQRVKTIIESVDQSISAASALGDERHNGAAFATANAAEYAKSAHTVAQVIHTLDLELPCIALCFSTNKENGL